MGNAATEGEKVISGRTRIGLDERDKEVKSEVLETSLYTRGRQHLPFRPHNLGRKLSSS